MDLLLASLIVATTLRTPIAEQTFTGTFNFVSARQPNKKHPITAVFTPDGPGNWKVHFACDWDGKPQTFTGTATGKLSNNSDITGEAIQGKRRWKFRGQVTQKELQVRHFEIISGKEKPTGEMTLTSSNHY